MLVPKNRSVLSLLGLFFILLSSAQANEGRELTRSLAANLIGLLHEVRSEEVTVGPLQRVEFEISKGVTAKDGVCVTYIAPVIKNGGRRREAGHQTFLYDPEYGWYCFVVLNLRGGEGIELVTEKKGIIQLK